MEKSNNVDWPLQYIVGGYSLQKLYAEFGVTDSALIEISLSSQLTLLI